MRHLRSKTAGRLASCWLLAALAYVPGASGQEDEAARVDYLTFAQGAVPISIGGAGAEMGPDYQHQVFWIDGDATPRAFINTEDHDVATEFTYQLPAATTFDRFAVPNILEVPSAFTTFTREVEVLGSSDGPTEGFVRLASGVLQTQSGRGQVQELEIVDSRPVRWVKIVLAGGIENLADAMAFEFSEIIGNGTQDPKPLADLFTGAWDSRFVKMELAQDGPIVSGCYDQQALLEGTVDGNILRARGVDQGGSQTVSLFVLTVLDDGSITGVRSTNGGPFRLYNGPAVDDVARLDCLTPPQPLGCGSIVYGINFDFDSATIRPESDAVLAELYEGLASDPAAAIQIRGHTSSEGSDAYNLELSQRRAQAVVDDLIARGLDSARMRATGVGEAEPIASNDDEAGRSLNRRVEVACG